MELGEKGVRVNSISPGPTRIGIFAKAAGADPDPADEREADAEAAFADLLPSVQAMPGMLRVESPATTSSSTAASPSASRLR